MSELSDLITDVEEGWSVVQFINGRARTVIEGLRDDCVRYLEDHFPRVHVEPGSGDEPAADAKLVAPNGAEFVYYGPGTGYEQTGEATKSGSPRKAAAKKVAAPSFNGGEDK